MEKEKKKNLGKRRRRKERKGKERWGGQEGGVGVGLRKSSMSSS